MLNNFVSIQVMEVLGHRAGKLVSDSVRQVKKGDKESEDASGESAEAGALPALLKRLDDHDIRVRVKACTTIGAFVSASSHPQQQSEAKEDSDRETEDTDESKLDPTSAAYLIRGLLLHVDDASKSVQVCQLVLLAIAMPLDANCSLKFQEAALQALQAAAQHQPEAFRQEFNASHNSNSEETAVLLRQLQNLAL